MYHGNHQQQQQPHHYANMANFPTIEHTNSSGSSIVSRDENYNPHYVSENMEKHSLVKVQCILCIFSYFVFSGKAIDVRGSSPPVARNN
jgi:hypothetical protein